MGVGLGLGLGQGLGLGLGLGQLTSGSRACTTFSWRKLKKARSVERALKYWSAHISLQLPTRAGGLAGVKEVATALAS